jgi:PAS domain S-box-containing protein
LVIGLTVLAGWALDVRILRTLLPGMSNPMVPSSAMGFVISGAVLLLRGRQAAEGSDRRGADLLAFLVMAVALAFLGGHLFGWDHALGRILYRDSAAPSTGEMAPLTAVSFLLVGAALLFLRGRDSKTAGLARALVIAVMFIAVFGLMGVAYRIESLANPMPAATALTFLVLCAGILALARQGLERRMGGWLLRRLLPASAVLIVVLSSVTRILNQYFERDLARAIGLVIGLGALAGLVWLAARALDRVDAERRRAVDRLREEQEEQRAILGSIGEGILTTDTSGVIASVNRAMERLAGWKEEEVVGHPYSEAYPLLDRKGAPVPGGERFLMKAMRSGEVVTSRGFELSLLTRDGRQVPVSVTAAPIIGPDGQAAGGVDIIRDVSYETDVDRLKSSLISTVSHELRTPLTMIQGFSELLGTRAMDGERVAETANQIHASAERLGRLIDDLLSVSRIESGRLEVRAKPLDLPVLVQDAVSPFSAGRTIRLDIDGTLPQVVADPDLVHRILTNLVSNAVKYSPADTMVTVSARKKDGAVEVSVTDEGIGLTDAELEQLFTKFFRAERPEVQEAGGTGLGLFITRSLVEMQGGQMHVESQPGSGSTFSFTLPPAAAHHRAVRETV